MSTSLEREAERLLLSKKLVLPKSFEVRKIPVAGYEEVLEVKDSASGLHAMVAVHNSELGPALGGTRIRAYNNREEALEDVLRLAKGMTYKAAVAEVGLGGGKSVILLDPKVGKTAEILRAFGTFIESLRGRYICAEDSGCTVDDIRIIRETTRYVVGLAHKKSSGNPAPFTAWGVLRGIQATMRKLFGSDSIEGKKVAVQGLGSVGSILVDHLFWLGADLIIADTHVEKVKLCEEKYRAKVVSAEEILEVECDVFAPCALGAVLNAKSIPKLRCKAVAGATNNQLHTKQDGELLRERNILYAPDFVINAGGLINVTAELEEEGYHPKVPLHKTHHLYDTIYAIYEIAERNRETTDAAAHSLAEYRMKYGIGKRIFSPVFHHTTD